MSSTIIESVLTGKLDPVLLIQWLNNDQLKDVPEDCVILYCSRSEFVAYFLSYLRKQTDSILQTNSSAHQVLQHQSTPEKLLSSRKHQRSISDPTYEADRSNDSLSVKVDRRCHESPCREKKKTGRRVKTKLFSEEKSKESISNSISSDESRISTSFDRISLSSSTPMKNGGRISDHPNLPQSPVTPTSKSYERCDTPQLRHRHNRSQEKTCFGDYLVTAQRSTTKKKKAGKTVSDDSDIKTDLDLSNSDIFPAIGARKASSLKSDKRRIKPTNIDRNKKSLSLNSFNAECFQQPSHLALEDNAAFKHQKIQPKELSKSFEAERNILRQERHKLMEKFNVLNSSSLSKPVVMPQIKITQKDPVEKPQDFTKAEATKVMFKEKLDILVEIYDLLLKNNLILSMNTEIYFLISILLSKQYEEEYLKIELAINETNFTKYLLKSIHNCTYFSVKSLWCQRNILEVILDKNSLKLLGENKNIRSFYPDLAKFLLNSYGLKCELENNQTPREVSEPRRSNGVICFNLETDNADNFPSIISFQNFKKQRDMFYEIFRWYSESGCLSPTGLRSRVKALVTMGAGAATCSHLARLLTAHALAGVAARDGGAEECKLSKLARRLTRPAGAGAGGDAPAPPEFAPEEMFYKEVIVCAESDSFRTAVRDALAAELCALNSQPLPNTEITKEYLLLIKKLTLLAKLLGYVTSLPYQANDVIAKVGAREPILPIQQSETAYSKPRGSMLEANVALRSCSQPIIDLKGMLTEAHKNHRLCITIPWLVHYLAMLDYTTLRIKYYQNLLRQLFNIYTNDLKVMEGRLKHNTVFLKSILGYLFTLPHFPQELFYESHADPAPVPESSADHLELATAACLRRLCPHVGAVTSLVSASGGSGRAAGSFRHITPLSVSGEVKKNTDGHLQARLEEEFLKSQPASTRRVLELVTERVCSGAAKEAAKMIPAAQERAREKIVAMLREKKGESQQSLLQAMESIYTEELNTLRATALESAAVEMGKRSGAALQALVGSVTKQLVAVAAARARHRLSNWMREHWSTTAILCKEPKAELRYLLSLRAGAPPPAPPPRPPPDSAVLTAPADKFDSVNVSPAEAIIELKEQICLVLEDSPTPSLSRILRLSAAAASPHNVFCRPPAQRAIMQLTIDLCIACVSRRPAEVTDSFLTSLESVWAVCCGDRPPRPDSPPEDDRGELSPPRPVAGEDDRAPTPESDGEDAPPGGANKPPLRIVIATSPPPAGLSHPPAVGTPKTPLTPTTPFDTAMDDCGGLELFTRLLCPRNLKLMSTSRSPAQSWAVLASVISRQVRRGNLSPDSLTEQCAAAYRYNWDQTTLANLASCLRTVSANIGDLCSGKMILFLDFLADYCGHMDVDTDADELTDIESAL